MESFCKEVITEIKSATNEKELIQVIGNSISQFRKKRNSYNEAAYIMNMIVSLRAAVPAETLATEKLHNIKLAIAIFKQFQKERPERIF